MDRKYQISQYSTMAEKQIDLASRIEPILFPARLCFICFPTSLTFF